jgi:hypothetical protein
MQYQSFSGKSVYGFPVIRSAWIAGLLAGAALLGLASNAGADQLQVTGANRDGNAVYDLGIMPSGATPITPVIASTVTQINSTADAKTHAGFAALVWVPNSHCKSLDLIVADASDGQIVRYPGASTVAGCYEPSNGTPAVSPTAQIIFKWSKLGSGPAQPNGISVDASGNLFVVSSSGSWDSKPSVWVLPFNTMANLYCTAAAGVYCPPVLIDGKFGGLLTLALAETVVASSAAVTSSKTVLWNAGDLLVLVGDSFDARLTVYAQNKLYTSNGLLNVHALPLNAPTSTPIPWLKFLSELADPFGMDIWPANTALGTNQSVLFTTIDGRILRFDTVQNKFITDFADRLGAGLQKIKVGTYANAPYAFVAQIGAHDTGQILVFGAPPASGVHYPLATISRGLMNPEGLAVINSGSQSLPTASHGSTPCAPPNAPCVIAPLGPEMVTTITAYPGDNISGTVVEQSCNVLTDPRVTVATGGGWTCSQAPLPIGAGTNYCPSFPAAVIPGSVCGHSGPTGAGFAVIEGTATGIDPNDNNSFISTAGNIDSVLPGANNLECAAFAVTGQIPLMAWGTRSDLTTIEGTIPEDSQFGSPLGGQAGYLTELTSTCDTSTSSSRGISIFAIGLGLSNSSQSYVYTLQNQKYEALEQTVGNASITNVPPSNVQSTMAADITTAENYVTTAQGGGNFTSNINCALNEIAATDSFLRANLPAFSSNLIAVAPGGGNPNPAGDIDGRLANWYTALNTLLAGNAPYPSWPLMPPYVVPPCVAAGPYVLSGTITNYAPTSGGLAVQDVVSSAAIFPAPGSTTFSFPTPLSNGDSYGIHLYQPTVGGQVCTVVSGDTGIVNGATPATVAITCNTPEGPTIGDFGTAPITDGGEGGEFYFSSGGGTSVCVINSLIGGYGIFSASSGTGDSYNGVPLPTGAPGYGTDVETLTCYEIVEGAIAAFSGPQIISNPDLPIPTLAITSFTYDSNSEDENFGNMSWTTSGATANTTCALLDEFAGDGETTPLAQNPIAGVTTGLPANSAPTYPSGIAYPYNACGPYSQGLYPDNMTLACTDPVAGTAAMSLSMDLSAECLIE